MTIKCGVYRCARKADTYLYLKSGMQIEDLPEGLLSLLGELTHFLSLDLNQTSKLAQVSTENVLEALNDQGYFLQMPPGDEHRNQAPGSGYVQ